MIDYAFIGLCLVAFAVFMYVVLDGFDLGVGILFPYMSEKEHETAMKSIAPLWDGNETWLVLGGALLYACFPRAYSEVLPAIYMPLMIMLCALVGRGVAFKFRMKAVFQKARWARYFFASSLLATFCQGAILGTFIQLSFTPNVPLVAGTLWFSPFVLLCGMGLCFGYGLLGSGWLVLKTKGVLQKTMRHLAICLYFSALVVLVAIITITPVALPEVATLWFIEAPLFFAGWLALFLPLVLYAFYQTYQGSEHWPFFGAIGLFLGCFLGLAYSVYPNLLPGQHYRSLAAHISALKLMLAACSVLLPVLLSYSFYGYWVFRGKVDEKEPFYY